MKLASIDIGTNSTRLLISRYEKGNFYTLAREMEITRIGKNIKKTGNISQESANKTLKVLSRYKKLIEENKVEKFRAVGTNALRKAENSKWFLNLTFQKTGINIEIISGMQEASLSFHGVAGHLDLKKMRELLNDKRKISNILIVDIGGGSTEFILGSKSNGINILESIEVGSVTLTEDYGNDLEAMKDFIYLNIENVLNKIKKESPFILIGLAGTITTLGAIDLKLEKYDRKKLHHHVLSKNKVKKLLKYLSSLSIAERRKVIGLDPKRADIIVAGTLILSLILDFLELKNLVISENDILDGIIYSMIDF